jgi:chorismate dehydratase
MMNPRTSPPDKTAPPDRTGRRVKRIGCVGYLNAKPLIEGLEGLADPAVRLDVPSALLADLETGEVDIALCPVIDYYRSSEPLVAVPVGCIASDGPTQTVRLFSRVPIGSITRVHADTDSHTSVALLRVLFDALHGKSPQVVPFDALHDVTQGKRTPEHEAMLLIGDKVVTNAPPAETYAYQMDLGEAWKKLTGLPFVFAIWMARRGVDLGDLPRTLDRQRQLNAQNTDAIADRHALSHGWAIDNARNYLGRVLSYAVGPAQLRAIELFAEKAAQLGLIEKTKPLDLYLPEAGATSGAGGGGGA